MTDARPDREGLRSARRGDYASSTRSSAFNIAEIHETWSEAKTRFTDRLAATDFADLTKIDEAIRAGTYQLPAHTPPHPTTPERRGTGD